MGAKQIKPTATPERYFAAGCVLFEEGTPGGELWLIRSGSVEVYRVRNGRHFHLARLGEGEMLGTMTAMSGGRRTASVKALTDVKVTVVPREQVAKLMGELPGWASALVKDLVARVDHANGLYIDSEQSVGGAVGGPLGLAARFAESAAALADLLSEKDGEVDCVDLARCAERLVKLLGPKPDLLKIAHAFIDKGIVEPVSVAGGVLKVTLESVVMLGMFAAIVGDIANRQSGQEQVNAPFAQGERRTLAFLASYGLGRKSPQEDAVALPLSEVEQVFQKQQELSFKPYLLTMAADWGCLKVEKSGAEPVIVFDPHSLAYTIKAYDTVGAIGAMAGKSSARKKSLDY